MEKVIKNGKVAILYSPGCGAGWFTCNDDERILFDPRIVEKVEQVKQSEITADFMKSLGYEEGYWGGAENLKLKWVEEGTKFKLEEYDGNESIYIINERNYHKA